MSRNIFQKLYHKDLEKVYQNFLGIIFDNVVGDIPDLQTYFTDVRNQISPGNKILISYHNHLWQPLLDLASKLGLRKRVKLQNWIDEEDLKNILQLSGFEVTTSEKRFFGITIITTAQAVPKLKQKNYSVSIVIPARNESGNISKIVSSIPKFGKSQEIIFVEGGSTDKTWEEILKTAKQNGKTKNIKTFKQNGKGKADAVWTGFDRASGEILIIYDADMTVAPSDLPKFYFALAENTKAFANGSRLVYPMENQAMQTLNKIGNKIFSILFTTILGQRFKDTLCGTKAIFKKDYLYIKRHHKDFFKIDPFGDFALIFGAISEKLKVVEIPIRYRERIYGTTNISRFKHGLILIRMVIIAFFKFRI